MPSTRILSIPQIFVVVVVVAVVVDHDDGALI